MTGAPSVWPALAAFAAVVALIPIALWVIKRLQSGVAGAPRAVALVGGLTLGPRERIAVVQVQGRRWMLGVTGQSITLLAELDGTAVAADASPRSTDAPADVPPAAAFAGLLDRLKRHG